MAGKPIKTKVGRELAQEWHVSKFGYEFDLYGDEWQLDGSITIRFRRLREIDPVTEMGFKKALCRYAEELSANHTNNVFGRFNKYFEFTNDATITVDGLINYRASLTSDKEHQLGGLRAFLIEWIDWGFEGIDNDIAKFLERIRLRGNRKGDAVRSACPDSGALTHNEMGALITWAANAFSENKLSLQEYSYFLALALTGRRGVQICAMRGSDLIVREDSNGNDYLVSCPRAKQRGIGFREQFSQLPINEDLFLLLKNQWESSVREVETTIGLKLSSKYKKEVPVFTETDRATSLRGFDDFVSKLRATPDYLHLTASASKEMLAQVSRKNTAKSERTGDYIHFFARRFRYTKGTNLARRGITGVSLAAALDHGDTQNVGVYTENTEEAAEQINEIMAPALAPLAQAFAGKLITSERDAIRANDPHSRIRNNSANGVGSCGTHAFCASGYRACYTCNNFQPWVEGHHEEVLDAVLEERKRQEKAGVSEFVIQATDRLLLAVQQVIQLCELAKSKGRKLLEERNV
ncbi:site-specific integrase [Endozoicomonas ascidiicola]|uniref:site-specific integrase n=1 Tax=Endozoicomonas ascidiicola TaxID=1698521 RepID=UPI000834D27C|nr:site-specific integrase [Endozoicomonas ascidiicola]